MTAISDHYNKLLHAYRKLDQACDILRMSREEMRGLPYSQRLRPLCPDAFDEMIVILNRYAELRFAEETRETAEKLKPLPSDPIRFGDSGYTFGAGIYWNGEGHAKGEEDVIFARALPAITAEYVSRRNAAEAEFSAYALAVAQGVAVAPDK